MSHRRNWRRLVAAVGAIAAVMAVPALVRTTSAGADPTSADAGQLVPIAPVRVVSSTNGVGWSGQLAAGQTQSVPMTGVGSVPATGVSAVMLHIQTFNSGSADTWSGNLWVWPTGSAQPQDSVLANVASGYHADTTVITQVGSNGQVAFANGPTSASVDVIADVEAYVTSNAASSAGATFEPVAPARVIATASGIGGRSTPLASAEGAWTFRLAGVGGIPTTGVSAVALNIGAKNSTMNCWVQVQPADTSTSISTYPKVFTYSGYSAQQLAVTSMSSAGDVNFTTSCASADIYVDVEGYYLAATNGSSGDVYVPISNPDRIIDTRNDVGITGSMTAGRLIQGSAAVPVTNVGGVPLSADAVALSVEAVNGSAPGYNTIWTDGTPQPTGYVSTVDIDPNVPETNLTFVKTGANGAVDITDPSAAPESNDLLVQIEGYFVLPVPSPVDSPTVVQTGASATVDWEASSSGDASNYNVTATPSSGQSLTVQTSNTNATVTGLDATTNYSFAVTACNSAGCSDPMSADQLSATPPTAPGNVTLASGIGGSMSVSWDAPSSAVDDQPNSLTGYTVQLLTSTGSTFATANTDADGQSAGFVNTTVGASYHATVTASNSSGVGQSAASSTVVSGAPNPVDELSVDPGAESLVVNWATPTLVPASYVVNATPQSGGPTTSVTASSDATSATVTGLLDGTDYSVSVVATNSVGSTTATQSDAGAPVALPGVASGVSASGLGNALAVTWTDSGANADDVIVEAIDASGAVAASTVASPDDNSAVLEGLGSGAYSVELVSENSAGSVSTAPTAAISTVGTEDAAAAAANYSLDQLTPDFTTTHKELTLPADQEAALDAALANEDNPDNSKSYPLPSYVSDGQVADTSYDDSTDAGNDFTGCAVAGRPNCTNTFYINKTLDDTKLTSWANHERVMRNSAIFIGAGGDDCTTGANLYRKTGNICVSYSRIFSHMKTFVHHWATSRPDDSRLNILHFMVFTSNGGHRTLSRAAQRANADNYSRDMRSILLPEVNDINRASAACVHTGAACRNVQITLDASMDEENGPGWTDQYHTYPWNEEINLNWARNKGFRQWNNTGFFAPPCSRSSCYPNAKADGWSLVDMYGVVYGLPDAYGFPQMYEAPWGRNYASIDRYAKLSSKGVPQYQGVLWSCNGNSLGFLAHPGQSWDDFSQETHQQVPYLSRQYNLGAGSCDA